MAEFDESKHKRDDGGKFSTQDGGGAAPKEPKKEEAREIPETDSGTIEIKGNELGAYSDIKELRKKAGEYYEKHLANTFVEHPELGKINFSERGWKKPKSFSADDRKLKVVPFLKPIISQGRVVEGVEDRKARQNVDLWYAVEKTVYLDGKKIKVRVNIRKDNNGKFYYDHVIAKPLGLVSDITNPGVTQQGVKNSIPQPEYEINIRFLDEADGAVRTVNDKPFDESKHKRDGDGKFSTQDGGGAAPKEPKKEAAREIPDTPSRPFSDYLAAHNGNHLEAAKDFYKTELVDGFVKAEFGAAGKKEVYFGGGKSFSHVRMDMAHDHLKAESIEHIPDILRTGSYISHGLYKPHPPFKDFHHFGKIVKTSAGQKYVIVDIGERDDGRFEYTVWSLIHEDKQGFTKKIRHLVKHLFVAGEAEN